MGEVNFLSKVKEIFSDRKKRFVILGLLLLVVLIVVPLLLQPQRQAPGSAQTPSPGMPKQDTSRQGISSEKESKNVFNPLISNTEIERVQQAYRRKFESLGKAIPPKPQHKFQYILSDRLKDKRSFTPVKQAFATTCNLPLAPATVNGYLLKEHYSLEDAKGVAKEFGFTNPPSSLPMPDGSSYKYYFSSKDLNIYLTLAEPSGTYIYHQAFKDNPGGSDVGVERARLLALTSLEKHGLQKDLTLRSSHEDIHMDGIKRYTFEYDKSLGVFPLVDTASIQGLGLGQSVCGVKASNLTNFVRVDVTEQGQLEKITNQTRKVLKTYSFPRLPLEKSLEEYSENPPIKPIVLGDETVTSGNVAVDEAALVWYDYDEAYAQATYIPMYFTSGRTAKGARVFTLFPAVAKTEIKKTEIAAKVYPSSALQLNVYYPPPPSSPVNVGSGGTGQCYGNVIDYSVTCSTETESEAVCVGVSNTEASNDPFDVCNKGCLVISEVLKVNAGQDPCYEFIKKFINPQHSNYYLPLFPIDKSQEAICTVQSCPC